MIKSDKPYKLDPTITSEQLVADERAYIVSQLPIKDAMQTANFNPVAQITDIFRVATCKTFILAAMNPIIINFNAYDTEKQLDVTYANVFAFNISKMTQEMADYMHNTVDRPAFDKADIEIYKNYALTNVCYYPNLTSCDGEYHPLLTRYMYCKAELNFPHVYNDILAYTGEMIKRRNLNIYMTHFTTRGDTSSYNSHLDHYFKIEGIPHRLFALSFIMSLYHKANNVLESHINPSYISMMMDNYENDLKFLNAMLDKYGPQHIKNFVIYISQRRMAYGYKIIPLNISEERNPFDIRSKPWREYFVMNKINDLIMNCVTSGMPCFCGYYYMQNNRKFMFSNKMLKDRIKNSEMAHNILRQLYDAFHGTYFAGNINIDISKINEKVKLWLNAKFKKVGEMIEKPINYMLEELIMSDTSLILFNEHTGRTFADFISAVKQEQSTLKDTSISGIVRDPNIMRVLMFDICYNLLVLNMRLGLIHGDLHLNNATIKVDETLAHVKADTKNMREVYIVKGKKYYRPYVGFNSVVIDFSRSIINPDYYDVMHDSIITTEITGNYNDCATFDRNALLSLYLQLFPAKLTKREELQVVFKNNFNAVFKLLSAIDLYMFTVRLVKMLVSIENVHKKVFEMLNEISKAAENFITVEMNHLIADPKHADTIMDDPWPIEKIMQKFYADFLVENADATITKWYNIEYELKINTSKMHNFPNLVKNRKILLNNELVVRFNNEEGLKKLVEIDGRLERLERLIDNMMVESYDLIRQAASKQKMHDVF